MFEVQRLGCAIGVANEAGNRPADCQIGQADEIDAIIFTNAIVIIWILECQRQQSLLLQIGFVYARETSSNHSSASKKPR